MQTYALPDPLDIAATLVVALSRAGDKGAVVVYVGRALDAVVELHTLDPAEVRQAQGLRLRDLDFCRQAQALGWCGSRIR